jgi:L-alanine-DL-glutamate epimerase-like enolase superfamily enzyme
VKITDIRSTVVAGNFDWILVRVDTDEGLVGLGEAYWGPGVRAILADPRFKSILIGEDPTNVDRCWLTLKKRLAGAGSSFGTLVTAMSGVELALWDLAGKAAGLPIYRLMGGKLRDRIRIYQDCGAEDWGWHADIGAVARQAVADGYTAIKFDVDMPTMYELDPWNRCLTNREIAHITEQVGLAREAIGDDVDLLIDCHWNYNVSDAIRLARELEPFKLLWLEDPVPPENVAAHRLVTQASTTPICTGENLYLKHGFRELISTHACDVVAPDVPKMGGLSEAKRVADLADLYDMAVGPHNVSSPIGTLATCHMLATVPNVLVLEFHGCHVPWWSDLVQGPQPVIKDGYITVPDGPGLGVELNEDVAHAHLRPGEGWFEM